MRAVLVMVLAGALAQGAAADGTGFKTLGAIGGAQAFSGDTIQLGETIFRLDGVECPKSTTPDGRQAKALANTFLRIQGQVGCISDGYLGDCMARTIDGERRLSAVMLRSGLCWDTKAEGL